MTIPESFLETFHQSLVSYKDHLMDEHNTRDMLPCVVLHYSEGTPCPLRVDRAIHLVGKDGGLSVVEIVEASIEGALATRSQLSAWAEETMGHIDKTSLARLVVRGMGLACTQSSCEPDEERGRLMSVWVGTDDYVLQSDHLMDNPHLLVDSALEVDFRENPRTLVAEALCTWMISDDGCGGVDVQSIVHRYTVGDEQRLEWGNAIIEDEFRLGPGDEMPGLLGEIPAAITRLTLQAIGASQ